MSQQDFFLSIKPLWSILKYISVSSWHFSVSKSGIDHHWTKIKAFFITYPSYKCWCKGLGSCKNSKSSHCQDSLISWSERQCRASILQRGNIRGIFEFRKPHIQLSVNKIESCLGFPSTWSCPSWPGSLSYSCRKVIF